LDAVNDEEHDSEMKRDADGGLVIRVDGSSVDVVASIMAEV
jgi:hypothetical protein